MSDKYVYLDNDFEAEFAIERKNSSTGELEAAASLSNLTARFSATDGGPTIHATLSVNLAERGTTKLYFGVIDGDALRTQLAAAYVGKTVWLVAGDGTNVLVSEPYIVKATRRPA